MCVWPFLPNFVWGALHPPPRRHLWRWGRAPLTHSHYSPCLLTTTSIQLTTPLTNYFLPQPTTTPPRVLSKSLSLHPALTHHLPHQQWLPWQQYLHHPTAAPLVGPIPVLAVPHMCPPGMGGHLQWQHCAVSPTRP